MVMAVSWNIISMLFSLLVLSAQSVSYISASNHFAQASVLFPPPSQPHPSPSVENNTSKMELRLSAWDEGANNMTIKAVNKSVTEPVFIISGKTGKKSVGFQSQILNYNGNHISLLVGNISKLSENPHVKQKDVQVSFNFQLAGKDGRSATISFVRGLLYGVMEGWNDNHFYKSIDPFSQYSFNLNGSSLTRIYVIMQKQATFNTVGFGIGFQ